MGDRFAEIVSSARTHLQIAEIEWNRIVSLSMTQFGIIVRQKSRKEV